MNNVFVSGMELTRKYFFETALPVLYRDYPELAPRLATGLVGNGSECFGYDDEISRDHDWGIDFFIWLTEGDGVHIDRLAEWKMHLFNSYPPSHSRSRSEYGAHIGVMTCGDFYVSLIGFARGPETIKQWYTIPEENLAMVVNGAVFIDGAGEFTATREYLLRYYPEDLRRKKIAARCMSLAQTGQYNLARCFKRADYVTLRTVISRFTESVIAIVFLLNRVFRPYYKWAYRSMTKLPILGVSAGNLLEHLALVGGIDDKSISIVRHYISELCAVIACELRRQGLSSIDDYFLASHGEEIWLGIEDDYLRSLPIQYE